MSIALGNEMSLKTVHPTIGTDLDYIHPTTTNKGLSCVSRMQSNHSLKPVSNLGEKELHAEQPVVG